MRRPIPIPLLCLVLAGVGGNPLFGADGEPRFEDDVRPLLRAKYVRCHGEKPRKADLDLSTPAGILKGGESGPAAVPGQPDGSPLYRKVRAGEMPPGKKDLLSDAEIETIRRWIAGGARFGAGQGAAAGESVSGEAFAGRG
jgi:hypothetical protein